MVMLLNDDDRITFHLSPAFLPWWAFCFSMTIGVLWEFFEFGMDFFLGTDMQKGHGHPRHPLRLPGSHALQQGGDDSGYPGRGHQRREPGTGRLPGYWHHRHHEGPICEFHGAVVFSLSGFFFARSKAAGRAPPRALSPAKRPRSRTISSRRWKRRIKRTRTPPLRMPPQPGEPEVPERPHRQKTTGFGRWFFAAAPASAGRCFLM